MIHWMFLQPLLNEGICWHRLSTDPHWQTTGPSLQHHDWNPHMFSPFEGTQVLKRDRATHKSITLIEADKNTNCALLNCWHWTGWIRPSINNRWRAGGKTGASRKWRLGLQTIGGLRLEHRQTRKKWFILFPKGSKENVKIVLDRSTVLYSCWLLQRQIYTHFCHGFSQKKSKTISLTSWK